METLCDVGGQSGCPDGYACVGSALGSPGLCVPKNIASFGGGPPLSSLPPCMQTAINNSRNNVQTATDDAVMGRLGAPIDDTRAKCAGQPIVPYCQQPEYYATEYCSCRNANLPYAECIAVDCTSNYGESAYLSTDQMYVRQGNKRTTCPPAVICQSIANITGDDNVAQIKQINECDGAGKKGWAAQTLPQWATALIILLLCVVVLRAVYRATRRPPAPKSDPPKSN